VPGEIEEAAGETSEQYEGIVLARAIRIVRRRLRLRSDYDLAKLLSTGRSSLYRAAAGRPCSPRVARGWYLRLEELLRCHAPFTLRG